MGTIYELLKKLQHRPLVALLLLLLGDSLAGHCYLQGTDRLVMGFLDRAAFRLASLRVLFQSRSCGQRPQHDFVRSPGVNPSLRPTRFAGSPYYVSRWSIL